MKFIQFHLTHRTEITEVMSSKIINFVCWQSFFKFRLGWNVFTGSNIPSFHTLQLTVLWHPFLQNLKACGGKNFHLQDCSTGVELLSVRNGLWWFFRFVLGSTVQGELSAHPYIQPLTLWHQMATIVANRTANLHTLHFKYLFNKYLHWIF
jgi:hypothetical protein